MYLEVLGLSRDELVSLGERVVRVETEVGEGDRVVPPLLNQVLKHLFKNSN